MLARKSTFVFLAEIIKFSMGFVSLYFIANYMGAGALGTIGIATGFIALFGFLPDFGLNLTHVKFL